MKTKRTLRFLGIILTVLLLGVSQDWAQPKPEKRGPIITHAFAVEKGKYGYIWKIYLEGEDPDGQMLRIASVVDEPGAGRYPTDWVYLKPQYRSHFKGYLQWNTFSMHVAYMPEWTQITLSVSVLDKAGNESNEVVFPFTFESGIKDQYKYELPGPFDQGDLVKLGNIMIDLYRPDQPGGNSGSQH